jgi:hypothetical protein
MRTHLAALSIAAAALSLVLVATPASPAALIVNG